MCTYTAQAQAPTEKWNKYFSGSFVSLDFGNKGEISIQTADGGYLIGGTSNNDAGENKTEDTRGQQDYWIIKTDANGTKQWDKRFGSTDYDNLTSMIQTTDGGYLLAGYSDSGIGGDKTQESREDEYGFPSNDYWIVKITSSGSKQWDKRFGGSDSDYLQSVLQSADGGYLLAGYSNSGIDGDKSEASRGGYDYWIVKITSSGSKQWDKRFGGSDSDELTSVLQTTDGGYLLAGHSSSAIGGDKTQASRGDYDQWIVKITSSGSKQWDKHFGGSDSDYLQSVLQSADGGYLLGGSSYSGAGGDKTEASRGDSDYWIVKITSSGSKQWDKRFGSAGSDNFASVLQTTDGGYLLAGHSSSAIGGDKTETSKGGDDYWIVKITSNGAKQWDKRFGSSNDDYLVSVIQTKDGGYLLTGFSDIPNEYSIASDYWIVKTNQEAPKSTDYVMSATAKTTCSGTFYDPGFMGEYAINQNITQTFTPATAGSKIQFSFTSFDLSNLHDKLYIYDGANTNAPLIGMYTSTTSPGTITATNAAGQLTLRFISNETYTRSGWIATISCISPPSVTAQWNKRFGSTSDDNLSVLIKTTDGGYMMGGSSFSTNGGDRTESSRGGIDYWVVKVNSSGAKQWDKRFGGSSNDYLNTMVQTSDGGYLLGGHSNSPAGGDKSEASRGVQDYWVVKISSTGAKQWDKRFGGIGFDDLRNIVRTSDGGYLLAGHSASSNGSDKSESTRGGIDYWIVKISSSGAKQWDKRFGGSLDDKLEAALQTTDSGYILGGMSASGTGGDKSESSRGGQDYWVVKLSSTGIKQWDKRFGGTADDYANSIVQATDGGFVLAGHSFSSNGGDKSESTRGGQDYWAVKITSTGAKQWDKRFGGSANDDGKTIIRTADGGYMLGGFSLSTVGGDKSESSRGGQDYWVVKLSSTGIKQWDKRFGGSGTEDLRSVVQASDNGYVLAGRSTSGISGDRTEASRGLVDYWIVKTTPAPSSASATARIAMEETPEESYELVLNAWPNPFSDRVSLSFTLLQTQQVNLQVYDTQGNLAANLYQGEVQPDKEYTFELVAGNMKPGIYLVRLATPKKISQLKLVLVK